MNQLKREGNVYEDDIYHPVRHHLKVKQGISVIGVIILVISALSIARYIYNDYQVHRYNRVADYVHQSGELVNAGNNRVSEAINRINTRQLTDDYMLMAISQTETSIEQLDRLSAPRSVTAAKERLKEVLDAQLDFFKQLQIQNRTHTLNNKSINYSLSTIRDKTEQARYALFRGLDDAKIQYDIQKDGTVRFRNKEINVPVIVP